MTIVPQKPDDYEIVALDISTIASNIGDRSSNAAQLWSECGWLCYGYSRPGPWNVRVEWHREGMTPAVMAYTTSEERCRPGLGEGTYLELLKIKSTADFTDGTMAPTPPGDLFIIKIWKKQI